MEQIKIFLDRFTQIEAQANYLRLKPNVKNYNNAYEQMNTFLIKELAGQMGLLKLEKLESEKFYNDYKDSEPFNTRKVYKISHYKHEKYKDVWVAYTSEINPFDDFNTMSESLFIIREGENYKIAKQYIYSSYSSDGNETSWEELQGDKCLTFSSLGGYVNSERYDEPLDDEESMKMYLEDL
ncbi:hypothetical protein Q4517_06795 [Tenacibaculum sp. 1_MG-2023]|uniref:hypothetical protein n=1 Tax=Tenacibaculum sp. 1_MG-2023 TaxID=3062653 RepID=UPI0026E3522A|nr:hypothetical protein [Tenacibaculum sp. 1_MG-2023]MDO6675255.1 hypothetical protein [Tenacibaculum sp. 1_MG-2023]